MTAYVYSGTDRFDDPDTRTCWGARGTIRGYGRHKRAGERPCDRCREAMNEYNRARRTAWEENPTTRESDRRRRKARARAWAALAQRHRAEYEALLRNELGRLLNNSPGFERRK